MESTPHAQAVRARRRYPWLKLAILIGTIVAGQAMVIPVARYAGPQVSTRDAQIALAVVSILLATVPLSLIVIPGLGLPGTVLLDRMLKGETVREKIRPLFVRAVALAIVSFAVSFPMLPLRLRIVGAPDRAQMSRVLAPGALGLTMLSGLGAGLQEEIMFRLGLLTVFIWILARGARVRGPVTDRRAILWIANLAQAYLFGLMHQALALTGSVGNFSMLGALVDPRTVIAVVFGYAAIRYGLETAIATHVLFDESIFVLATLWPLLFR
jgi:hypothetical protein